MKIYRAIIHIENDKQFESYVVKFEEGDDYNLADKTLADYDLTDDDIYYYYSKSEDVESGEEVRGGDGIVEIIGERR